MTPHSGSAFNENRTHNDVHELISINSDGLAYDSKGNMTSDKDGNTLVWDIDNHLVSFTKFGNGEITTFTYDAIGRRLEKITSTKSTLFICDGQRVVEEYEDSGSGYNLARSYTYGTYIDDVVAKIEAVSTPTVLYYHSDRQFNIRGLTDTSGAVKELYAYTPYGKQTVVSSSINSNNNYGFTGRYIDNETGLWYFRARYFSDELGRFISRDPLGYIDGMGLYTAYFAEGFDFDPMGLSVVKVASFGIYVISKFSVEKPPKKPTIPKCCDLFPIPGCCEEKPREECKWEHLATYIGNKALYISHKNALNILMKLSTKYANDSLAKLKVMIGQGRPIEEINQFKNEVISTLQQYLFAMYDLAYPDYEKYSACCNNRGGGFSGAGASGSW